MSKGVAVFAGGDPAASGGYGKYEFIILSPGVNNRLLVVEGTKPAEPGISAHSYIQLDNGNTAPASAMFHHGIMEPGWVEAVVEQRGYRVQT